MIDWLKIIIPAVVSISGFFVTYKLMKKEFENSVKKSISEDRKSVYEEIFRLMNKAIDDCYIVYETTYLDELINLKPKAYLFSSATVKEKYINFCNKIFLIQKNHRTFCEKNDPEKNKKILSQIDIDNFEEAEVQYRENHVIKNDDMREILYDILEAMRKDIGIND